MGSVSEPYSHHGDAFAASFAWFWTFQHLSNEDSDLEESN